MKTTALSLLWLLGAALPALADPPAVRTAVISVETPAERRIPNLFRAAETLRAVHGVESVEIRAGRSDLRTVFDPETTSLPEIVAALEEAGFRARRDAPLPVDAP